MFERFTDRARRVVVLAQEEARMLDHNYIGTEHILLGLLHEGEGVGFKALDSMGIPLDGVRAQVEGIIGRGQSAPAGHIPFTPRAKKVLELSLREALQLGHDYIGTEHVLLGLVREGEGVAAQVLVKMGADLTRVRRAVMRLLGVSGTPVGGRHGGYRSKAEAVEAVVSKQEQLAEVDALAEEEAKALGSETVEPEHKWLGTLRLHIEEIRSVLRGLEAELDEARGRIAERKPRPGDQGSGQP
ncbi:MAG: hypothetical protein E6G44_00890 [Actinobacteria bacterium]|nr:MAG: hypothetical protein E6G44_00890 [Actinomycetota bacterium]